MSFFIRILLLVTLAIAFMMTTGCSSLEFRNIAKTSATSAVTYLVAGPIPAVASMATSMAFDELVPDEPKLKDVKTKTQAVAHVATSWGLNALYGFIAFLLITNILTPLLTKKWGYNEAKNKYRRRKDD
jgi:hypothetical protein